MHDVSLFPYYYNYNYSRNSIGKLVWWWFCWWCVWIVGGREGEIGGGKESDGEEEGLKT